MKYLKVSLLFAINLCIRAQNPVPQTTVFNTPFANQPVPTSTIATQKINLTPGFHYGNAVGGVGSVNSWDLRISSYASPLINGNYIDPDVQPPVTYNANLVFGSSEGNYNVTPTGQFSYNLPIICSPGTRGVEPRLNISYNSLGINGIMGVGFNLSGISSISRIGSNRFSDGKSNGISLTNKDYFALDGSRLFLNTGNSYGDIGATYVMQSISHQTITSFGSAGTGPAYFILKDPKGYTIEYGASSDSKLISNGDASVLTWNISKITDEFGNYMTFSYDNSNNSEVLIDRIEYTGNQGANLSPYNKIQFTYIARSDKNTVYFGDKPFNSTKLLKSVECSSNSQLVHKYIFDYQFSVYSLLYKISEIDADGNQLNPTIFKWGEPGTLSPPLFTQQSFAFLINNGIDQNNIKSIVAPDLNGDGYSDLVGVASNDGLTGNFGGAPILAKAGAQINNMAKGQLFDLTFDQASNVVSLTNSSNFKNHLGSFIADKDHDGKQEVYIMSQQQNFATFSYQVDEISYNSVNNTIQFSNVYDGSVNTCTAIFSSPSTVGNPLPFFFDIRDYNDDGLSDMVIVDQFKIRFKPGIAGNSFGTEILADLNNAISTTKIGDFNGDGRLEFYVFKWLGNPNNNFNLNGQNHYGLEVFEINSNSTGINSIYSSGVIVKSTNNRLALSTFDVGDFNGDGKTDVFSTGESQNQGLTFVRIATGTGFQTVPLAIAPYSFNDALELSAEDLNGDNKSDLVIKKFTAFDGNNVPTASIYNVSYSFGSDVITDNTTYSQSEIQFASTFGDFNADGNADYFVSSYSPVVYQLIRYSHLSNQKKHFLTEIQSPRKSLKVEYTSSKSAFDYHNALPQVNSILFNLSYLFQVYIKESSGLTGDLVVLNPDIYLVSRTFDNDNTTRYNYVNGVFNKGGATPAYQFLGFEKMFSGLRDLNPNIFSTQSIGSITSHTYNSMLNILSKTQTLNGLMNFTGTNYQGGNSPIVGTPSGFYVLQHFGEVYPYFYASSKTSNEFVKTMYPVQNQNSQIFYNDKVYSISRNYLNSTNSASTLQIDNSAQGNPASNITTYSSWNNVTAIRSTTTAYTYFLCANNNFKPANITTTSFQQGDANFQRTIDYSYDQSNHLISKVTDANQNGMSVTTSYGQFNAFGSPTQFTISAPDIQSRISSVAFDPTARFLIQKTNAIGNSESYISESKYGNLTQSTDISGLITKYKYDGMGRITETDLPNTAVNKIAYNWDNSNNFNGSYSITAITQGAPTIIQLLDKNSNLIQVTSDGFNGSTIISTSTYDAWNRMIEGTDAHFTSQTMFKKVQCEYNDLFYRKSRIKNITYSGTDYLVNNTDYLYNNPSDEFNYSPGSMEIRQLNTNTSNNLNSVKTFNNEAGQMSEAINYDGPSMQNTKQALYSYKSNGGLNSVNLSFGDGGTSNTQLSYDPIGRQSALVDQSSGNTQYQYNSIGELTTQITPNGTYNFVYDQLGRVTSKTGSGTGATYYQYVAANDGKQNLLSVTGPNNTTEFKYDFLGRLTEQKETIGAKILKTNYAYDMFGNVTKHTFPSNFSVDYVYDNIGTSLQLKNGNTVLWQRNSEVAPGLINVFSYQNGTKTNTINYVPNNPTQLYEIAEKKFANVYDQFYTYENLTGDNKQNGRQVNRTFANTGEIENFFYDDADRLNFVTGPFSQNITYKDNGNIASKNDAGNYVYGNLNQPYNLTNINNPSNNISLNTLNVMYNDFKKVSQISEMGTNKQMNFTYGNNNERIKMDYSVGGVNQYTRYYTVDYDREESPNGLREWNYIKSPTGLAAVYYNDNGNTQLLYVTTDKLGSPLLLSDASGQPVEEYSFDAWGRRRNPVNWTFSGVPVPQKMIRGYCMHEMLDEFKLINMNGRVYDPVLGRFVQPDNFVENPTDLQTYNRYAYCRNNPIRYTDPSGNWEGWDDVAAITIGGITNVAANWDKIDTKGGVQNIDWGQFASYFAAGAIGGEATLYLGPFAGAAIGGAANVGVDAAFGHFSSTELAGRPLALAIGESFATGAISSLSGGEAAAEAEEIAGIEGEDIPANFRKFSSFIKAGPELGPNYKAGNLVEHGVYFGIKRVAEGFGAGDYEMEDGVYSPNINNITADVLGNFTSGFSGSVFSDFTETAFNVGEIENPFSFAAHKLLITYGTGVLSNTAGELAKGMVHSPIPYNSKYFDMMGGPLNNASFNGVGQASPELTLILLLTIIKGTAHK